MLDANVCIYLLQGEAPLARSRVELCEPGQVVTSAIAQAEVLVGAMRRDTMHEASMLFGTIPALPFDEAAARAYAGIPFRRGGFDRLIAAHALALSLTLVTNKEADFDDLPDLLIENWTKE